MERMSDALVLFLFNALWQLTLVVGVATLCARLMRSAPGRYSHLLWMLTLALCCTLPLWSVAEANLAGEQVRAALAGAGGADGYRGAGGSFTPFAFYAAVDESIGAWVRDVSRRIFHAPQVAEAFLYAYLLILCHRASVLWRAWRRTRAIRRSAYARELTTPLSTALAQSGAAFRMRSATVLCSREVTTPLTMGVLRPVVVLPESFYEESRTQVLTAVLAHEMAHIRRRDYLFNLLFELIHTPVAFHPAAALVKRRLAETRELACDEMVVGGHLLDARSYARTLVQIAVNASALGRQAGYSLGISETCNLEERIMRLMKTGRLASARAGRMWLMAAALLLLFSATGATAFSLMTQEGKAVAEQAIVGTWNAELPNGVRVARFVFKSEAGKLTGHCTGYDYDRKIDPNAPVDKSSLKITRTIEADLMDVRLEAQKLRFRFDVKPPVEGPEKLTFNAEVTFTSESAGDLKVVVGDEKRELRAKVVKQP